MLRELTRKATRDTVFAAATLAVFLGLLATGHGVPETLSALVFSLVVNQRVRPKDA